MTSSTLITDYLQEGLAAAMPGSLTLPAGAVGFYYQILNNYLQSPAVCTVSGLNTSSNKCAGGQYAGSFLVTYAPAKRVELYAGMMVSNVYGGLASGYFKTQNLDPTVGFRVRF